MKYTPKQIGFIQAIALSLCITFFSVSLFRVQAWAHFHNISLSPILGILLFLLMFVISALISTSIIFAHPITLFFDGNKRDASGIIFWSVVWLVVIFTLIIGSIYFFAIQ